MRHSQRNMPAQDMSEGINNIAWRWTIANQQGTGNIGCPGLVMSPRIQQQDITVTKRAVLASHSAIMHNRTIWSGTRYGGKTWQ